MMLTEQIAALRQRKLTAVEAVSASLRQIERWQEHLNAFVRIDAEEALAAAHASDARRREGAAVSALDGVPFAYKDMFDRVGYRCRFGSRIVQREPEKSAAVMERMESAGAIAVGALNMAEFALGPTGHNAVFGHCRNPWDATRIAGGSSSGAAAAVAAGIVGGGIGSDTGGSIRIPAACCGVVGLKPTQDRVSVDGAMPLAPSLDCVGVLARSAVDCTTLFQSIAGAEPRGAAASYELASLAPVKLAFPREAIARDADPEVAAAIEEAVREFASRGAGVRSAPLPDVSPLHDLADVIQQSEVAHAHLGLLAQHRDSYTPHILRRIEAGLFVAAPAYLSALNQRSEHRAAFLANVLGDAHALVLPVLGITVPRIDETDLGVTAAASALVGRMTRWTRWLNYLGVPALAIPCGVDRRGMPIGLQLVGRPFAELTLLQIASLFQQNTPWHARQPLARGE